MTGKIGSELEAGVGEVCEQWWEEENAYRDLRVMQGEICLLEFWNQFRNKDHKHTDGRKSTLTGRCFYSCQFYLSPSLCLRIRYTYATHCEHMCARTHTHTHTHTHTLLPFMVKSILLLTLSFHYPSSQILLLSFY